MVRLDDELDVRGEGGERVREGAGLTAGWLLVPGSSFVGEGRARCWIGDFHVVCLLVSWVHEPGEQEGGSHYENKCSLKQIKTSTWANQTPCRPGI